jgi:hypothetical protein
MFTGIARVTTIVTAIAAGTLGAAAQTRQIAPQQSNPPLTQPAPPEEEDQGAPPRTMQGMPPGMMQGGYQGMMRHRPTMRMPMLKIMFAIMDTDEDGSISFDEVTAVHKRIFDAIDTDRDGKVTFDELDAFMRGP